MTTAVPSPTLGAKGYISPTTADILTGVQADYNAAFGGNLNPALNTPQGQLSSSEAAIIADKDAKFLALANGIDPAYASGRMQDAIGRIYYLTRIPAASTVVTATCTGAVGTIIPINAQAVDQSGNKYLCTAAVTIPIAGHINTTFSCVKTGAIACPIGFLNSIYQAIPGWDLITNATAGTVGNDVESRTAFELRRSQSVAVNSQGSLSAILGSVLSVPGVVDAYVMENDLSVAGGATFTGTIALGFTLTVSAMTGTVAIGQMVTGTGVSPGTYITGGAYPTFQVNVAQAVGPVAMVSAIGGYPLVANSIYVAAYGGNSAAIAAAIFAKKSPGSNYNGNTAITVSDTGNGLYTSPYPTYNIKFNIPTPVAIKFVVTMANNINVPSDAVAQVQAAIIASFNGTDGGTKARIGSNILEGRYYSNVFALGSWVQIYEIDLGVGIYTMLDSILMQADQIPTLAQSDITVNFV
jgi:hypothetical protein